MDPGFVSNHGVTESFLLLPNETDTEFFRRLPKFYIPSTLNNSNETYTFMCLGRAGRFGQY